MKKILIALLAISLSITFTPVVNAFENEANNDLSSMCGLITEDDLDDVTYTDQVYDEDGNLISFNVIIPLAPGEEPVPQTKGIISGILAIISGNCKVCRALTIQWGGFNPCTYLAGALGREIVDGYIEWANLDVGEWKITRNSYWGSIPGCLPMNAPGYTGWYYTYSYSYLG